MKLERQFGAAFGEWVRQVRTEQGWTQGRVVAEVIRRGGSLDQGSLSRIENGRRATVGLGLACVLTEALGGWIEFLDPAAVATRADSDAS